MSDTIKDYCPKPLDTSNVKLPRDLQPLVEKLASNNHDVWAVQRMKEGWTYGSERNDEKKQTPCLVDYKDLPESEKDYDRKASLETLKTISKLGFSIVKKTTCHIMIVGAYSTTSIEYLTKRAQDRSLSIIFYDDWETAKNNLGANLTSWHAIILDSKAKLKKDEDVSTFFLRDAIDDLNTIFTLNRNRIPWFIFPESYDGDVEQIIKYTVSKDRIQSDWGRCVYKYVECDDLFAKIAELLPSIPNYRLRNVYDEVFSSLEKYFPKSINDSALRPANVKDLLFGILQPLHSPEIFFNFDPTQCYDNVRKVLEAFFIACCNYSLIPTETCYDHTNGSVNLRGCADYLQSGVGKQVFPISIGLLADNILNRTNPGCHFGSEDKINGFYYSVISLSLQMCDIIVWFGQYITQNGCESVYDLIEKYKNKVVTLSMDGRGNIYYDKCCFGNTRNYKLDICYKKHSKVRIVSPSANTYPSKKYYPIMAKFVDV